MSKIISQVLRLSTGRSFDPSASPALSAVQARVRHLGVTESYEGKDPQRPASFFYIIRAAGPSPLSASAC